jgi:hypothetical protein
MAFQNPTFLKNIRTSQKRQCWLGQKGAKFTKIVGTNEMAILKEAEQLGCEWVCAPDGRRAGRTIDNQWYWLS